MCVGREPSGRGDESVPPGRKWDGMPTRRPYDERMRLLHVDDIPDDTTPTPVLVVAMDGWTDAGTGGSIAARTLREAFASRSLGQFPPDALYDYRDRRPLLSIDRGELADPQWPELTVELLSPPAGPPIVLIAGGEPDFAWQTVGDDLVELAERLDATRYVGLGSVPGPVPHSRPIQLVSTSNVEELRDRMGPHEQMVVPASCQVVLETRFRDAGLQTLGLWARVPHYVAGEFPAASRALLERFSSFLGTPVDLSVLDEDIAENRQRLDMAAEGSEEVTEHIRQLEELHDAEQNREAGEGGSPMPGGPLPSGDEIAAEVERFLRGKRE